MKNNRYLYWITFIAVLSGLIFGLNMAGISGAVSFIQDYFVLSDVSLGAAVGSIMIGCLIGALAIGSLSDKYGRKPMMILAAVLFILSSLGCSLADSIELFIASRFVAGLGVGAVSVLAPTYISEIAPANMRGMLVANNQFAIVIGILLAYVIDFGFVDVANGWRYMMAVPVVFGLIFLVLLLTSFPESPRWLAKEGRPAEALNILTRLVGKENAQIEFDNISSALKKTGNNNKVKFKELFKGKVAKVVLLGSLLAAFQQITGINAVISYAPTIFSQANVGSDQALLQSVLVGVVNLVATIVALWLVDRKGRKVLLLWGTVGMTISLMYMVYSFTFETAGSFGILMSLLGYIAFFAASLAPVMWVVTSEIYPNRIRGLAMSFSTGISWVCTFLTVQFFPWMLNNLGGAYTFGFFGLFSLIAFIFILIYIPETKGKTLEQLEVDLALN
ncbi:sugar porter family MFS transporter [Plebeiibacterium marinum]|uniref:Sugar porter family MFS transporter n=1 Tax=Plebeiibacterium marinum TaxID=2992111 RepID=A0AAE3MBM2_9BACT|nr:sugar porter family MFS transporter [Plebeiobacterium marinum]MCW3804569.1 sugar porter family MFS transporter [Plebeiobacterium marinum]